MRITIELEPADLDLLATALEASRRTAAHSDEVDIIDGAKHALDGLCAGSVPSYIRKRLVHVQRLIVMLEDEAWALPAPEREEVLATLAYFSDPEDLIADDIQIIGLLDDAIVLELLVRRMRHVLSAYDRFCAARRLLLADAGDRIDAARRLAAQRVRLQARMRRPAAAPA
ncbi:YkvA family protein [Dokdonella koreensis]|uniref:DUF1232 domain-containing protein n=1 Tax=Dokdonella koreensis DS-123 TaxID=1300342 RepID=A0A160DS09_9GAMM|nr:YkvA family protein [Dokdonella koreensis]ANB17015.1 Hypothetical protein I596_985 [Dokdonella koreensis DS-123]